MKMDKLGIVIGAFAMMYLNTAFVIAITYWIITTWSGYGPLVLAGWFLIYWYIVSIAADKLENKAPEQP